MPMGKIKKNNVFIKQLQKPPQFSLSAEAFIYFLCYNTILQGLIHPSDPEDGSAPFFLPFS